MFSERISANSLFDWELVRIPSMPWFNQRASGLLNHPCNKLSYYSMCDLSPMLGNLYSEIIKGYQWWGNCNLDVITGDLDSFFEPYLDTCDLITIDRYASGAFMLWRNTDEINSLYLADDVWKTVVERPEYFNYDETNFGGRTEFPRIPNHYDGICKRSGLRVHYEMRHWDEAYAMKIKGEVWEAGTALPSKRFRLSGNKLLEATTGEEICLQHLGSKVWPVNLDGSPRWGCCGTEQDYFDKESVYKTWEK